LNELLILSSKVWSFHLDDERKKLILKTSLSDSEIDQCALSLDFWWVMRIGKLGVHEEVEVGVKSKLLISHLNVSASTFLDDSSTVHGLDDSVDSVLHVLDEYWSTVLYTHLDGLRHLGVRKTSNLEVLGFIGLSDPEDTLKLWVNDQRVSLGVVKNGTVLSGYSIWGQTEVVPSSNGGFIR